jgi:CubicO group peptidase (beta-lactamase class C family)
MNVGHVIRVAIGVPGWFLIGVGIQSSASAQQSDVTAEIATPGIGRTMDDYMRRAEALGFSGQVLVAKKGEILLHRAYGFSDRINQKPMTTETAVGVASMSKQFAAAAVLKLESEGKLKLSDTLGAYFRVPADKQKITIQQLLTHTAGIRGGTTEDFDAASLDTALARLFALPLTGVPGAKWQYSSDAYGILAAIVQKVSGKPYEQYMHEALLAPAGMNHSRFWYEARGMPSVAHAYFGLVDRGSPAEWPRNWRVFGSGDLLTTASDLYRWDRALRSGKVLRPETLTKYFSPQVPTGFEGDHYGYGLFVTNTPGKPRVIEHGGDTELGFNGAFFRYPDDDAVLIITSNARDGWGRSLRQYVQADIEKILFGRDSVTKLPAAARAPGATQRDLAGEYAVGTDGRLQIISDGSQLWIAALGQPAIELLRPVSTVASEQMLLATASRTDSLIKSLIARDTMAYVRALGDSGAAELGDYKEEWARLGSTMGPLRNYHLLGSMPDRNTILTYARLFFLNGVRTMAFRWSNLGRGRLVATNPQTAPQYPVILPLVVDENGELLGYDSWRGQERVRVKRHGQSLEIQRFVSGKPAGPAVTTGPRYLGGWAGMP